MQALPRRAPRGSCFYPFSAILAETILEHGLAEADRLCLSRLPAWERRFWLHHPTTLQASRARSALYYARKAAARRGEG